MYFVLCTTTYALGSAVFHACFQDAKAQELPRLNRSSMHNLATGTFIFCRALESILSSSSSDPGVCQVSISVTVTNILNNRSSHQSRDSTICTKKCVCVCTHPRAKVLTPIEVIIWNHALGQFWALANQHLRSCRQLLALGCCRCGLAGKGIFIPHYPPRGVYVADRYAATSNAMLSPTALSH